MVTALPIRQGSRCYEKLRVFGLPAMPGWLFVRRGFPDRSANQWSPRDATTVGTGMPAVAEDGGAGDHCPHQLVQDLLFTGAERASGREKEEACTRRARIDDGVHRKPL